MLIFLLNFIPVTSCKEIGRNIDNKFENDPFIMLKPGDILMIHEPRYDDTILGLSYWSHCLIYVGNDEFIDATGMFGVRSIPSLLFVPMNEQPQMAQGALPKDAFEKAIKDVLKVDIDK